MYCIKCGVKLSEGEKKCPLCETVVYHPDFKDNAVDPLYPPNKIPRAKRKSQVMNGASLILFFIPLLISFLSDYKIDRSLEWFGFVAGALLLCYIIVALPCWFTKPNPVIFVPCDFLAIGLYLFYISLVTGGNWFFTFALPITFALCLIVTAVITLLRYVKKGKLYVSGGAFIAMGGIMVLIEYLSVLTFKVAYIAWSFYPLIVFVLLGGTLIYFAINKSAREVMERKLFF